MTYSRATIYLVRKHRKKGKKRRKTKRPETPNDSTLTLASRKKKKRKIKDQTNGQITYTPAGGVGAVVRGPIPNGLCCGRKKLHRRESRSVGGDRHSIGVSAPPKRR
jgi:hypothetical protein